MKKQILKTKNEIDGITLIALVITIIVLLILAGISIVAIQNSGVFENAKEAKELNIRESVKEEINLEIISYKMENANNGMSLNGLASFLEENLNNLLITEINDDSKYIKVGYKGYEFQIDENFVLTVLGKNNIIATTSFEPSGYVNEDVVITIKVGLKDGLILESVTPISEGIEQIETNKKFKVTENGTYEFLIKASGENNTKNVNVIINNIDKNAPIIESVIAEENTAVLKANDMQTGIVGYAITQVKEQPTEFNTCEKNNNLEIILKELSPKTVYFAWVIDNLGNISLPYEFETESEKVYLYNQGDENSVLTGGWKYVSHGNGAYGNITKMADCFYMERWNKSYGCATLVTNNKVSITGFDTLKCEILEEFQYNPNDPNHRAYRPVLCLANSNTTHWPSKVVSNITDNVNEKRIYEVDISGCSGEYYPALSGILEMYVYRIWLE